MQHLLFTIIYIFLQSHNSMFKDAENQENNKKNVYYYLLLLYLALIYIYDNDMYNILIYVQT